MRTLRAWFRRLHGVGSSARTERELAAEIHSHLQLHIDDNLRAGMTREEARLAALLKFGPSDGRRFALAVPDAHRRRDISAPGDRQQETTNGRDGNTARRFS